MRLPAIGIVLAPALLCHCSLLFDLRDLSDGADAGGDGDQRPPESGAGDALGPCVRTGAENCTNGRDDDCNGLVDCADPACQGAFACTPVTALAGWRGPAALYEGPAGMPVPDCPTGYQPLATASGSLRAPPAVCSCTCVPSEEQCASTDGNFYSDQACGSLCADVPAQGDCEPLPPGGACSSIGSFRAVAPVPSGTCTPSVTRSLPATSFDRTALLCGWSETPDVGAGCAASQQCLATPAAPFGTSLCIYHVGDPAPATCPAGSPFVNYHVYYADKSDSRDCGPCTCTPSPVGGSCDGQISIYTDAVCIGAPAATYAFPTPSCQPYKFTVKPANVQAQFTLTTGGTCSAIANPTPIGSVQGTQATVVCCLP